jgi:hypothetical protein
MREEELVFVVAVPSNKLPERQAGTRPVVVEFVVVELVAVVVVASKVQEFAVCEVCFKNRNYIHIQ